MYTFVKHGGSWVRYPVWQHTFVSPSAFSRRAVVSYWRKYVHEVLVNRLGGLSLPRKSVVRLTDRRCCCQSRLLSRGNRCEIYFLISCYFLDPAVHFSVHPGVVLPSLRQIESIIGLRSRPRNANPRVYG